MAANLCRVGMPSDDPELNARRAERSAWYCLQACADAVANIPPQDGIYLQVARRKAERAAAAWRESYLQLPGDNA